MDSCGFFTYSPVWPKMLTLARLQIGVGLRFIFPAAQTSNTWTPDFKVFALEASILFSGYTLGAKGVSPHLRLFGLSS